MPSSFFCKVKIQSSATKSGTNKQLWSWASSLQNCEKISLCGLRAPSLWYLLWQPWRTSTASFPGPGHLTHTRDSEGRQMTLKKLMREQELISLCVQGETGWVPIRDITLGGKMDQVWETWHHVSTVFLYKLRLIHGRQLSLPSSYIFGVSYLEI